MAAPAVGPPGGALVVRRAKSEDLVLDLIELLQEHVARFDRRGSSATDAYAADRLMVG